MSGEEVNVNTACAQVKDVITPVTVPRMFNSETHAYPATLLTLYKLNYIRSEQTHWVNRLSDETKAKHLVVCVYGHSFSLCACMCVFVSLLDSKYQNVTN